MARGSRGFARLDLAQHVLEQFEERRAAGEAVFFEDLISAHSELEPELRELRSACVEVDRGFSEQAERARKARAEIEKILSEVKTGADFSGRYILEGEIGQGGMGAVLRVRDRKLDRPLAMKVILGQAATQRSGGTPAVSPQQLRRFLNEARITSQLDHPGIVPVHEVGVDEQGRAYFTMKLVRGRTLAEVFDLNRRQDPQWSTPRVLETIRRVCEALAFAHEVSVIHRDLKPLNVMVGDFGEVYVMDWGLARRLRNEEEPPAETAAVDEQISEQLTLTRQGLVLGTPYYMPPEQARGDIARMSPASDVYAIGAMLYEVVAKSPPYTRLDEQVSSDVILARIQAGPPERIESRVLAPELAAIIEKAMSYEAESRYTSVRELQDDLERFAAGRAVRAFKTGSWVEVTKWVGRNKLLAVSLASAVMFLVCGSVASLILKERADRGAAEAEIKAAEVLRLSALQELDDLLAEVDQLWPAGPEMIPRYDAWMEKALALVADIPQHEALLASLRARALPQTEDERIAERRSHPEYGRWQELVESLVRQMEVVDGSPSMKYARAAEEDLAEMESKLAKLDSLLDVRRDWRFGEEEREARWWNSQLTKLIGGLVELKGGLLGEGTTVTHGWSIPKRRAFASSIAERSVSGADAESRWAKAISSIANSSECPAYGGLALEPQMGLVPIGRDSDSGLWEFSHLQTGETAIRDDDGRLVLSGQTGLVFVLLPGGAFAMGAQKSDPNGLNFDAHAQSNESPVHEVDLSPFFLSKYEMTQGQWLRVEGRNPSYCQVPEGLRSFMSNQPYPVLLHPVEQVSWSTCKEVMDRLGLSLPSEAQWEYGARGGKPSVWWTGDNPEALVGAAELVQYLPGPGRATGVQEVLRPEWGYFVDPSETIDLVERRYFSSFHTLVTFHAPNPFGLFNVHGNVWEWCLDGYSPRFYEGYSERDPVSYAVGASPRRVYRGGSFDLPAEYARSAHRTSAIPEFAGVSLGIRPARAIQ